MPHLTLPILADGPVLDVIIGVSHARRDALNKARQSIPKPVKIRALIDTGASGTVIDSAPLGKLNLQPTGQIPIHTPSTEGVPELKYQFDVSIIFVHPAATLTINEHPIIESSLAAQGIQALIGRDLLARCVLVYDGAARGFILGF